MDTITNTAHCMWWSQQYSLEFLLGVELFHERFGTGKVYAVDDERECCCVCFKGAIQIEIAASDLQHLKQPWHVNVQEIGERFLQYQASIDNLEEKAWGRQTKPGGPEVPTSLGCCPERHQCTRRGRNHPEEHQGPTPSLTAAMNQLIKGKTGHANQFLTWIHPVD